MFSIAPSATTLSSINGGSSVAFAGSIAADKTIAKTELIIVRRFISKCFPTLQVFPNGGERINSFLVLSSLGRNRLL